MDGQGLKEASSGSVGGQVLIIYVGLIPFDGVSGRMGVLSWG